MREIKTIINAHNQAVKDGKKTILATVVHVDGSSYRRPSARMLVDENGITTGAISGGCLEGDALRKALYALHQGKNTLVTYDTSDEEDAIVGAQLGCNGIIQVLFEPVDVNDESNPIRLLSKAVESRRDCVMVSFFDLNNKQGTQKGTILLIENDQLVTGTIDNEQLQKKVFEDANTVLKDKTSLFRAYVAEDFYQNVFIEYFTPPVTLVIVGAGNDTQGLAQMAETLGWKIFVVDGRPTHAKNDRFVSSCQVIVSKPENVLENVSVDDHTVFVLLTHNYQYDLAVLQVLLGYNEIPYIGILGPKKKFNRMLNDLKEKGIEVSDDQLKRIYAPVGLEIGAETPEEISISILSEIKSVLSNVRGGSLRDKNQPIHSKDNTQFDTVRI
jgi:xanthine/CO dehydrogenase XdhC/CoxF family maturation factor